MFEKSCPLVTIIVPAYNVEKYITECLDSLVNQTKKNHKIVIVNDGSTDCTEEICLDYQKKHSDIITYIYQENQGLGSARNTGMKVVDTPYLTFLDSDDWLNIKYVECFTYLIEGVDELPDMVFTLPWVYDSVTKLIKPWKDKERYERIFEVQGEASPVQTNSRMNPELYALEVTSCRKTYKTSFLEKNKFSFPQQLKWEDVPGHFYLLHQANTCMALPEVGFFYRINQGGQITAGDGASRLDLVPIFKQLLKIEKEYDFNVIEKSYVLRLIVDFSLWSVEATNMKYIESLLNGLHEIFQSFTEEELNFYLSSCSENEEKERRFIACLAGKNYLDLKDYEHRDNIIEAESTYKAAAYQNKNLIQGGVQCICDHGISYTIVWIIRKYLLKKQ